MIYKPENYEGPKSMNATMGFKFSNDVFLLRSFLDQQNIPYDENELEDGPYGKFLRIKKEKK